MSTLRLITQFKYWFFLLLVIMQLGTMARAEGGNAQAFMTLIVLPTDENLSSGNVFGTENVFDSENAFTAGNVFSSNSGGNSNSGSRSSATKSGPPGQRSQRSQNFPFYVSDTTVNILLEKSGAFTYKVWVSI